MFSGNTVKNNKLAHEKKKKKKRNFRSEKETSVASVTKKETEHLLLK